MTTYSTPGHTLTFSTTIAADAASPATFEIFINDGVSAFDYTLNGENDGLLPGADINLDFIAGEIGGKSLSDFNDGAGPDASIGQVVWIDGGAAVTSYVINFYDDDTGEDHLFQIGGAVLPVLADTNAFNAFFATQVVVIGGAQPGSGFEAGASVSLPFAAWTATEDDEVDGTNGDDFISAGSGGDFVEAGTGNDTIEGGTGRDILYGQAGQDEIYGGGGNDYLIGGGSNDVVYGGNGVDRVNGGSGADDVFGEIGNDRLYGNGGSDDLFGGSNDDLLVGGGGNDFLTGGDGEDALNGGRGRDVLTGGAGADSFNGGSDRDTFVFASDSDFGNTIVDYQDGIDRLVAVDYDASDLVIAASGADTIVSTADFSVTLVGIDSSLITTDDFTFDAV